MKEIVKSGKLAHVRYDIRGAVMAEAERMSREGIPIVKLNIGNPAPFGFVTPQVLRDKMAEKLTDSMGYSDSKGIMEAREACAKYAKKKGIPNVTVDDVYTGNGVSELITMSMQAFVDSGDEILVPAPDYPLWTASVTLSGGKAVHYLCDEESDWFPDVADIRRKITPRTKGIVIINPNNPTGALYSEELLLEIVKIAREHNLVIFSDEIYDRLVMDGLTHTSIASLAPDLFTVTYNGLSKSHLMAGYRCGFMMLGGPKEHAQSYIEGITLLASMRLCSNVQAQQLLPLALAYETETKELLVPGGRFYEQRECVYNAIRNIPGLSAKKPKAAFYLFPKMDCKRFHILDDEKMVLDLLREKHILFTCGTGFNWPQPDHFRIVYLPEKTQLMRAMTDLGDFLQGYRQ